MPLTRSRTLERLAREGLSDPEASSGSVDGMSPLALRARGDGMQKRKRTRSFSRGASGSSSEALSNITAHDNFTVDAAGLLGVLPEDTLLFMMHEIVRLPRLCGRNSLELRVAVLEGAKCLRALQLTCRYVCVVLEGVGAALHAEMAARASTHIVPPLDTGDSSPFPFTHQLQREQHSSRQLAAFQEAISSMAVHCAGPCCSKAHAEFSRGDSSRRITSAARRSTVLTAPPSGECAFVASKHRQEGFRLRGRGARSPLPDSRLTSEWIIHVSRDTCKELNAIQLTDLGQLSPAHSMRASSCGAATTLIRSVYASHVDDNMPHSVVMVWNVAHAVAKLSDVLEPPAEAEDLGAINAQDAWWVGDDAARLAVLWSTGYVHPMGSVVGANANSACYFIAVYTVSLDEGAEAAYSVDTYTGPFHGKAQTASPTRDGHDVAVLVRKRPVGAGPGSLATATRCTMMHNVSEESAIELTHATALCYGRGQLVPPHPQDVARCPSAVALSPTGDSVVAVHRRALTVILEVLIRTAPNVFVSVQRIDISHWTSIGNGEASIFDEAPESGAVAAALKLPYSITFSPCGRFVAVVDQRPLFGLSISNHSVVVLDMARRNDRRGVRALPLAAAEDVAPRSLEWTRAGIWLQPKYGAVLLESE